MIDFTEKDTWRKAFVTAVAINAFFVLLCLIFGDIKFGAIDDYFMAAILTGAHGTAYNPHLVFVNAIYGYALIPLYKLFPTVGWYYIGEMFAVFLGLTTISYILIRRLGQQWGTIIAALFTALFASDFYLVVQFTQCASILSAAGMLAFANAITSRTAQSEQSTQAEQKKSARILPFAAIAYAVFLLLWGSIMRWQAFLMGMPFFALGLLFLIKDCWRARYRTIAALAVMFMGAFAMHDFDRKIYQDESFKAYNEIQGPRVTLGEGGERNQNGIYEDAEEIGLSGKDYHMLTEWTFYDTETFNFQKLSTYTKIADIYIDPKPIENIPKALLNALGHSLKGPLFWTWFIFCLLIYATNRNKAKSLYLWASLGIIFSLMIKLLMISRLVYRVESGFWLYTACLAIPLVNEIRVKLSKKIFIATLAIIAAANIATYASSGETVRDPSTGAKRTIVLKDSTNYEQVFKYIGQNKDKMFLLSMDAYKQFSHHKMPPYKAEPIGSYYNTISFGYWTPYLPEVTQALKEYGITNPIKDVVLPNVVVINEGGLQDFLQRHYYDSVAVDTLKVIGEMNFYKYRLVE